MNEWVTEIMFWVAETIIWLKLHMTISSFGIVNITKRIERSGVIPYDLSIGIDLFNVFIIVVEF